MAHEPQPPTRPVAGRVAVPASLRYEGALPDRLRAPAPPAAENPRRNVALTFAVVLLIALGGYMIFRPKAPTPTVTWHSATDPSASPTPTQQPLYDGPAPSGDTMPV